MKLLSSDRSSPPCDRSKFAISIKPWSSSAKAIATPRALEIFALQIPDFCEKTGDLAPFELEARSSSEVHHATIAVEHFGHFAMTATLPNVLTLEEMATYLRLSPEVVV
jgi:hypothetical protein